MTRNVVSLRVDMPIRDAWHILSHNQISGAPVVDAEGRLVGVLSQSDLARRAFLDKTPSEGLSSYYHALPYAGGGYVPSGDTLSDLGGVFVEEIMNPYVLTVNPEDTISTVAAVMRSHKIHRVVVAREREVMGVLSASDLLALFEQQ